VKLAARAAFLLALSRLIRSLFAFLLLSNSAPGTPFLFSIALFRLIYSRAFLLFSSSAAEALILVFFRAFWAFLATGKDFEAAFAASRPYPTSFSSDISLSVPVAPSRTSLPSSFRRFRSLVPELETVMPAEERMPTPRRKSRTEPTETTPQR